MVNMKLDKRNEQLIDSLKNLKLHGMAEDLKNQFENEGLYSTVTFSNRLEQMINKQLSYVAERKYASLVKRAKIRDNLSFNELKYDPKNDGVTTDEIAFLASNSWATDNVMNIFIQGATGAGRTALSSAMALNLCKAGISVVCYRWCDLVDEILLRVPDTKASMQLQKQLCKYTVLLIDDFCLQGKMPSPVKEMLYKVTDSRWKNKSTVFTSQLNLEGIVQLIGEGAVGNAIVDRLLNPSKIVTLNEESKR